MKPPEPELPAAAHRWPCWSFLVRMKILSPKHILLLAIVLTVGAVLYKVAVSGHYRSASQENILQKSARKLPEDVETFIEGYNYSEKSDDMRITITGNRIIRRGRKLLGLRSNLVKSNFFEDIRGTLNTPKGTFVFSASDAEWSALSSQPFILEKNVAVAINGRSLAGVKSARIYFKQGLLKVQGTREELYTLK